MWTERAPRGGLSPPLAKWARARSAGIGWGYASGNFAAAETLPCDEVLGQDRCVNVGAQGLHRSHREGMLVCAALPCATSLRAHAPTAHPCCYGSKPTCCMLGRHLDDSESSPPPPSRCYHRVQRQGSEMKVSTPRIKVRDARILPGACAYIILNALSTRERRACTCKAHSSRAMHPPRIHAALAVCTCAC